MMDFLRDDLEYKDIPSKQQEKDGVATIVHGTIVQGDSCPRDFCPMTQLSKQTIVRGDFFPRKHLPVKSLLNTFVLF